MAVDWAVRAVDWALAHGRVDGNHTQVGGLLHRPVLSVSQPLAGGEHRARVVTDAAVAQ